MSKTANRYACCDHLGNWFSTQTEMCAYHGVNLHTYRERRRLGKSVAEALDPINHQRDSRFGISERTDHTGQTYRTKRDMCKAWGIPLRSYEKRRRKGMSKQEALTIPLQAQSDDGIEYNGIAYPTVDAFCEAYGITKYAYYSGKTQGLSLDQILAKTHQSRTRQIEYAGVVYASLKEFLAEYGVPTQTWFARKRKGWSTTKILNNPPRAKLRTLFPALHIGNPVFETANWVYYACRVHAQSCVLNYADMLDLYPDVRVA